MAPRKTKAASPPKVPKWVYCYLTDGGNDVKLPGSLPVYVDTTANPDDTMVQKHQVRGKPVPLSSLPLGHLAVAFVREIEVSMDDGSIWYPFIIPESYSHDGKTWFKPAYRVTVTADLYFEKDQVVMTAGQLRKALVKDSYLRVRGGELDCMATGSITKIISISNDQVEYTEVEYADDED